MTTYKQLLTWGRNTLRDQNIESYLLDGRLLLEHAANVTYTHIFSHFEDVVQEDIEKQYRAFIDRRVRFEPVAKILASKEFWGLPFKTTAATLDPRPDSETLIEAVFEFYPEYLQKLSILELGVGTGCLLLTLLHLYTRSDGVGTDISDEALDIARYNAENLKLESRTQFLKSVWFDDVPCEKFDIILSNPPYIPLKDAHTLAPDVHDYDPHLALFGGEDGLDPYRILFKDVQNFLKGDGLFILEHGINQEQVIAEMGRNAGFTQVQFFKDLAGVSRVVAFRP